MDTPWYASLNSEINSAYAIAQAYYTQRENQFKKVVFNNSVRDLKAFTKQLTATAKSYRHDVYDQVKAALDGGSVVPPQAPKGEYQMDVQALYNAAYGNKKGLQFIAGEQFEYFLRDHIRLTNRQGQAINSHIVQQVGKVVNTAFTTSSAKDTRTDVAIAPNTITKDTIMELTIPLDLHNQELQDLGSERKIVNALMRDIIAGNVDLSVFGFQAKTYRGLSGMKWMTSQPLAAMIRQRFAQGQTENMPTWSSNYASLYTVYFLSKYIINIVNPVNIGIVYTGGFQFMSDFLARNRFYMNITMDLVTNENGMPDESSSERGGGYEGHPKLASNEIMMRTLNNGAHMITANTVKHRDNSLTITLASVKHNT